MAWTLPLDLAAAYRAWFFLDELFLAGVVLVLWTWWRPLGAAVPVALAVSVAALTAIPDNAAMGQANLPVVLAVVGGLVAAERGRARRGGALLGVACMAKMSPALLVLWWLWRGRWRAAAWACATGAALSVAALAVSPPEATWRFYTDVLPRFGSGNYNGLRVPIDLFANHSIPNLWWQVAGGGPHVLSPLARVGSSLTSVALLAGLAVAFRGAPRDALETAGQVGAVVTLMLLSPVYCYEHHLVWTLVALPALGLALWTGRLGRAWAMLLVPAAAAVCVDLGWLTAWARLSPAALAWLLQEAKTFGLAGLLAGSVALGWRPVAARYADRLPGGRV
jgi:hypothetical protein